MTSLIIKKLILKCFATSMATADCKPKSDKTVNILPRAIIRVKFPSSYGAKDLAHIVSHIAVNNAVDPRAIVSKNEDFTLLISLEFKFSLNLSRNIA